MRNINSTMVILIIVIIIVAFVAVYSPGIGEWLERKFFND